VVTGGATAPSNNALLTQGLPRVSYCATVHTVAELRRVMTGVLLDELRVSPSRVAYLKESTTSFGQSLTTTDGDGASRPIEIPFPMNISRLRSVYSRDAGRGTADTLLSPGAPRPSRIPLDLRDPASTSESPPVMSDLTAATIERTLYDIAQTLLVHRTRVVGIIATDVRDRLFLAAEVRTRLPDVQVFLVGSHSLYLRPELNDALRGTYVVSTYPLFLESQFWRTPGRAAPTGERLVFTTDQAEGTYNAMLAQFGRDGIMVDYEFPFDSTTASRPPVWVTMVGRTTMVPLVARRAADDSVVLAAALLGRGDGDAQPAARTMSFGDFDAYGHSDAESALKTFLLVLVLLGSAVAMHWSARTARAEVLTHPVRGSTPASRRLARLKPSARRARERDERRHAFGSSIESLWPAHRFELFCHREVWLLSARWRSWARCCRCGSCCSSRARTGAPSATWCFPIVIAVCVGAMFLASRAFRRELARAEMPWHDPGSGRPRRGTWWWGCSRWCTRRSRSCSWCRRCGCPTRRRGCSSRARCSSAAGSRRSSR
jgi:hypothetical protein